jgi:hypothetical protein
LQSQAASRRDVKVRKTDSTLSAQSGNGAIITPMRRFPPPWTIDEANSACFIVRDNTGQALAYVYFEDEPGKRSVAKLLTRDEARWMAANSISGGGKQTGDRAKAQKVGPTSIGEWRCATPLELPDQQRRKERFYRRSIIHRLGDRRQCRGVELIAAVCAGPRMEDVMLVLVFRPFRGNQ